MMVSKTNVSKKSGGCGCGGGSKGSGSGCSCGGTDCGTCNDQVYVRPNFFAGQLLTEEDLQSLSDYVVAKNRLHNRYLFGDGVVCGLEVNCHPCGGGKVIVKPGYAIDCCGNDITLACAQELDINAMIRELRFNTLGGYDCGDPCNGNNTLAAQTGRAARAANPPGNQTPAETEETEPLSRHYCLYIRYCETPSDPVSPYMTDGACGFNECKPTRVREGARFELRCPEEKRHTNDMACRIISCIADILPDRSAFTKSNSFRTFMNRSQEIAETKNLNTISFQPSNVTDLEEATRVLAEKRKVLTAGQPTEQQVWEAVEATLDLAKLVARNQLSSVSTPGRTDAPSQPAVEDTKGKEKGAKAAAKDVSSQSVEKAVKDLEEAKRELAQITNQKLGSGVDKEYATAMFSVIDKMQSQPDSDQVKALALGQVYTPDLSDRWTDVYSSFLEDLIEVVERSDHLSDCSLREEIAKIRLPAGAAASRDALRDVKAIYEAGARIEDLLKRYVRDCVCAAMLPPCPACDDTAVLLACLEVRDCKVIDICNLARTFVISPVAFRYWVPVGLIGDALENSCCPDMCDRVEAPPPVSTTVPIGTGFGTIENIRLWGQVVILNLFRNMAKACGATYTDREIAQVLSVLFGVFRERFGERRFAASSQFLEIPAEGLRPPATPRARASAEARIDEAAVQAAVSKAVSEFINQATIDESSEFGRSVLAMVEKKIAEQKPKRGSSK